ncbi:ribosomal protein S16 domain-containing protein [Multifurca ochricompacta]|uniref:Ribosomal protein S16 domain-containing protein n=1 Tax=Multifurca ochricompacta TaxID=376703 RepID=A0AAD4MD88_9AGAM|nr:ribosomal protein S16 domain-containing protein [Multifurca ochricompacta]
MPVRLRLSMHGNKNNRIFHLVATDLRKRRDAKPIELLGIYDPRVHLGQEHKTMHWSVDRIRYWLEKGAALPSKPVVRLLERGGIIPPNSKYHPNSHGVSSVVPSNEPGNVASPSSQSLLS